MKKLFIFSRGPLLTFDGSLESWEQEEFNGAFKKMWEWVLMTGRRANADSTSERGEYHIFRLFKVARRLKLVFFDISYIL